MVAMLVISHVDPPRCTASRFAELAVSRIEVAIEYSAARWASVSIVSVVYVQSLVTAAPAGRASSVLVAAVARSAS